MASKSVGMFQRPVEYKLNCLEMVYEFSGLELEYLWTETRKVYHYFMNYSGFATLELCFSFDELLKVKIYPDFDINSVHSLNVFTANVEEYYAIEKTLMDNSYSRKIFFYENIRSWVKSELIRKGFVETVINSAEIKFSLSASRGISNVWLAAGSVINDTTDFTFTPTGAEQDGHTVWTSPVMDRDQPVLVNVISLDDGAMLYADELFIDDESLIVND